MSVTVSRSISGFSFYLPFFWSLPWPPVCPLVWSGRWVSPFFLPVLRFFAQATRRSPWICFLHSTASFILSMSLSPSVSLFHLSLLHSLSFLPLLPSPLGLRNQTYSCLPVLLVIHSLPFHISSLSLFLTFLSFISSHLPSPSFSPPFILSPVFLDDLLFLCFHSSSIRSFLTFLIRSIFFCFIFLPFFTGALFYLLPLLFLSSNLL